MNNPKQRKQKPGVIFQPRTYIKMKKGIDTLVAAIRPTLGPMPRSVAIERITQRNTRPEVLDNGGIIARRIIQLPNRDEDMGAMYLRHVLWELHEKVGDGTATAAVLFQSIFSQGIRYVSAGGNPMRLRIHLENAFNLLSEALEERTIFLEGKKALRQLAYTICHDPELAKLMGEIFDIIGEYGRLEIRSGKGTMLEREYVEGMYWDGGLISREMINDFEHFRSVYEEAAIVVCDLEINEPQEIVPLLELAIEMKTPSLILMAKSLSDRALSVVFSNREKVQIAVIKLPGISIDAQMDAMEDISILTGAVPLYRSAGDMIEKVGAHNVGRARRIWANLRSVVIVGGKGDARNLRQHITTLRAAYKNSDDKQGRKRMLERIGKLLGGSATLWIGAASPLEIERRKELAEQTAEAMRGAMREGVVAGGGIALLECRQTLLERADQAVEDEERAAYRILIRALEQPAQVLLENAGLDDALTRSEILVQIRTSGDGKGYDIMSDRIVDMVQEGICDSAAVTRQALYSAIHGAALCLTTDVLVHRRVLPESVSKTG